MTTLKSLTAAENFFYATLWSLVSGDEYMKHYSWKNYVNISSRQLHYDGKMSVSEKNYK